MLELGRRGGNNAFHIKQHCSMTLVDISGEMLQVSQTANPECEHVRGDMRTVRLGREFEAVIVHDAISLMATVEDLKSATDTCWSHCAPGGTALSTRLRVHHEAVHIVAVEPEESAVLSGQPSGSHKIEGTGAGFVVPWWTETLADEIQTLSTQKAMATARRLARERGGSQSPSRFSALPPRTT